MGLNTSQNIEDEINRLVDNDIIKIISKKIITDLNNVDYYKFGTAHKELNVMCGAIIYIAYIKSGNPKPLEDVRELVKADSLKRTPFNKEIKDIKRALGMKYCETQTMMGTNCILLSTPKKSYEDLCRKENVSPEVVNRGLKIIEDVIEKNYGVFTSLNPNILSASILYIASTLEDKKIIQRLVADSVTATETSIRNIMNKILNLDKELKKEYSEFSNFNRLKR